MARFDLRRDESVTITVAGKPTAKGRPHFTKSGIAFTPTKTRSWEAMVKAMVQDAMFGRVPMAGPVRLDVRAVFVPSESWPDWKKKMALVGRITHTAKPDVDNIVKIIKDACNGVMWTDDSYVCVGTQVKDYGPQAMVVFTATPIDAFPCQIKRRPAA